MRSELIEQVRAFVRWSGAGRKPTKTGRVTMTDARVLVEFLADPAHEEHRFMLDWLGLDSGDQFDPARFDPDDANRRLVVGSRAVFIASGRRKGV